ncbi:MAG: penicillin-binding protein 2 [Geminicoccaceae bacterium]|nr:penicillin-binding protein 2 [Geminicoccaceae bacterium]
MHQESDRTRCFRRRALLVGGAQLALMGGLAVRLWQLQVRDAESYRLLAEENRINQRLTVPPRGVIVDRRGRPLAVNVPTYRVRIVREQAKDVRKVLEALAEIVPLDEARIDEVVQLAKAQRPFVPVTVRENLSWEEVARIAVRTPDLPGVLLDSGLVRRYPHGPATAHVVGYVGPVSQAELEREADPLLRLPDLRIGKNGIEQAYDRELRGRAGLSRVEVNAIGREIREIDRREGEEGADLQLSLDLDLQRYCMERLADQEAAAAVVLEVATGAVLAMASVPTYDPGAFAGGLSPALWRQLTTDPRHPLFNKCIRGTYPPGSTFKMITAIAALEAGVATPSTEVFCPGHMSLGNARFHCWRPSGHGRLALVQALAQSCDVYFYELARRVGIDALASVARRFGAGVRLGIDLPGEKPGLMPDSRWKRERLKQPWQKGETLVCGIGQGFVSMTPLQLAVMTARLCNGGREVHPWVVRGPHAHVSEGKGRPAPSLGVSRANLEAVLKGMFEVVNGPRGTAKASALPLPGVYMAGKTGTSQVRRITKAERAVGAHKRKDRPREERDHALFVCYAPHDRPRYAVAVVVEHGESGAKAAAPIARDIMVEALRLDPSRELVPGRLDMAERG